MAIWTARYHSATSKLVRNSFSARNSSAIQFPRAKGWALDQTRCLHYRVTVKRDVPYSAIHPRNVMDIYEPYSNSSRASETGVAGRVGTSRPPTLLFVHGGMWLRGAKDQKGLSPFEAASEVVSQAFSNSETPIENGTSEKRIYSNVGAAVAKYGGSVRVMNYRLAGASYLSGPQTENSESDSESGHPSVIDVARAIVYVIEQELHLRRDYDQEYYFPPNVFVMGHSAGAHLAALALTDTYIQSALSERGIGLSAIDDVIAGFVGISGVYNLKRLAMHPLAAITVGPAFGSESDVVTKASPVHVLLEAHANITKEHASCSELRVPPLVRMPLLLLNAESDFHLKQDSSELFVALHHFDNFDGNGTQLKEAVVPREQSEVAGTDHLSIIKRFGSGMVSEGDIIEETTAGPANARSRSLLAAKSSQTPSQVQSDADWTTWTVDQAYTLLENTTSSVMSYFSEPVDGKVDETALRVLQFMSLMPSEDTTKK